MDRKKAIPTVQVYESTTKGARAWYWRSVAANGKIKADGGESYNSKAAAIRGLESTLLPPYQLVVLGNGLGTRPTEYVGVVHPRMLKHSDNPRNFSTVAIETVR